MELTTVAPDEVVAHDGVTAHRWEGLGPDTEYDFDGLEAHTLPRPAGELLTVFATVNDVHFGETVAGLIDGVDPGGAASVPEGSTPYPTFMNADAITEITALDPAAVLLKGDLTSGGTREELDECLDAYRSAFDDRLHFIRGNHESYHHVEVGPRLERIDLPGVVLAMFDTSRDGRPNGTIDDDILEWLDDEAATADRPMLLFGHHQIWTPTDAESDDFFGIVPPASRRLWEVVDRHPVIEGYFAGHTHRNRRVFVPTARPVPFVEVAAVKDFPGSWAEYRVYEGGVVQIHRRISTERALAWSERCRGIFGGAFGPYAFGELSDRCFVVPRSDG